MKSIINNLCYITKKSIQLAPLTYIMGLIAILFDSVTPFVDILFPKWILDELTGGKEWRRIIVLILLWVASNTLILLVNTVKNIFLLPYMEDINMKEGFLFLEMDANMDYERLENGDVLDEEERIRDNLSIAFFAYHPWSDLITAVIQLCGYVYILTTLHPLMIVFLVLIIGITSLLRKHSQTIDYQYEAKISKFNRRFGYLFKTLTSYRYAKEVRINRAAEWLAQKYKGVSEDHASVYGAHQRTKCRLSAVEQLIAFVQMIVLYAYSAFKVITGAITIGDFSMYIGIVTAFSTGFVTVVEQIFNLKKISSYVDALKEYEEKAIPTHAKKNCTAIPEQDGKHEIEFCHVSFQYPGSEDYALRDVSLKITTGERLSIVGFNGAGKTTLIKLICRLYEPTEGVILYNGSDISTLDYAQYLEQISVVFQDFNVYSMSIRENACLNCMVSDVDFMDALEQNGLLQKVEQLPLGADTQVGKEFDAEGVELSGGEAQKLACVRAQLKNSPIIILDEPTAALDPISEVRLYERFERLVGNKTTIYISHRLSSVALCDHVAVFERGKMIEYGTHRELLAHNGTYREMFDKQAEYFVHPNTTNEEGEEK